MKKLLAFSLAEVLIALSIVGIVGALTLPNVKKTYMQKEAHAKATKVQHVFDTATLALVRDKGSLASVARGISDEADRSQAYLEAYSKYMKFTNVCGKTSSSTACFPTGTFNDPLGTSGRYAYENGCKTINGIPYCAIEKNKKEYFTPYYPSCLVVGIGSCVVTTSPGSSNSKCATAILNDGTAIAFCDQMEQKNSCNVGNNYCPDVAVYFDIKGPKNLSTLAMTRNVFFGYLSDDGFNDYNKTIASISNGSFSEQNYKILTITASGGAFTGVTGITNAPGTFTIIGK